MKVIVHYEDHKSPEFHKTLKITLPRSWKNGPASKLLNQFIESYNSSGSREAEGCSNRLIESAMHLACRRESSVGGLTMIPIASDAIILDCLSDREEVYVKHGPSKTLEEMTRAEREAKEAEANLKKNTVQCTRFGCTQRFPKEGPYPDCCWHKSPPVFHETVKYWSCCPQKKAYDWDEFQSIVGCQTGLKCTPIKESNGLQFLGGSDLRKQQEDDQGNPLRSIDDFNKSLQSVGDVDESVILEKLSSVMVELGVERALFQRFVEHIRRQTEQVQGESSKSKRLLDAVRRELGTKLNEILNASCR